MTTIVYEHESKTVACDGRVTSDGVIRTDYGVKWRRKEDAIFFFAGLVCEFEDFMAYIGIKSKPEIGFQITSIMIKDGKAYLCGVCKDDGWWQEELHYNAAIGSGGNFAISALDFGRSPREAVEFAGSRDVYTGGEINVFDIEKMNFL